jgi:hypothetical protein
VGSELKIKRMIWCLAEAWRAKYRKTLSQCSSIALHQDKGRKRLHIRFTAASSDLARHAGVVGIKTMTGGHAEIIKTTAAILTEFCTRCSDRPRSEKEKKSGAKPKGCGGIMAHGAGFSSANVVAGISSTRAVLYDISMSMNVSVTWDFGYDICFSRAELQYET